MGAKRHILRWADPGLSLGLVGVAGVWRARDAAAWPFVLNLFPRVYSVMLRRALRVRLDLPRRFQPQT